MFKIVQWTRHVTDDHKDKIICDKPEGLEYRFRLLDDDRNIYAYGYTDKKDSFAPLDHYEPQYGCTEIQYQNPDTGDWETL